MYADERHTQIMSLARARGRVDVNALAQRFDITTETVRRDLDRLERRGLLRRVHGGALPIERVGLEPAVAEREIRHRGEKVRIGRAAVAHLPMTGAVLIDAGTTTIELASALPDDRELTVVTNALHIAMQIAHRPNYELWMPGGRVRGRTLAQVDAWALRSLADVRVDVAFVATNGVAVKAGLTTPDFAESEVKRRMIAMAERVVLLADSSKVDQVHLARFGDLADIDVFITDERLPAATFRQLASAGPEVECV